MAKKTLADRRITTYDDLEDLFSSEEQRQEQSLEKIREIPLNEISEFKNHPFRVRMDDDMIKLVESVEENGVLIPVVVRPSNDGYEMISGHRRLYASQLNNNETIQAIVRDVTDEQAIIMMVDSNIQRENILPTERGFAYKMKLDAMKHQGRRTDLTSTQLAQKLNKGTWSVDLLSQDVGESRDQIRRYIRLTELIEPLRDMVDGIHESGKKIALNPAVELSYLTKEQQNHVVTFIDELELTPSHAQTIRMKELSKQGRLDENVIYTVMSEVKANQKEKISFKMEDIDKFFPKDYTPRQMQDVIYKLLTKWQKNRNKQHER